MKTRVALLLLGLSAPLAAADYVPLLPNPERAEEGIRFDDVFQVVLPDGTIREFGFCGTPAPEPGIEVAGPLGPLGGSTADCDGSSDPTAIGGTPPTIYDPGQSYLIDVWIHVIRNPSNPPEGDIPVVELFEQVAILNEDLRAIPGSNGSSGTNGRLFFRLKGYDFWDNATWFGDGGAYYNSIQAADTDGDYDPQFVVNVYTNDASGNLGYVPFLPHTSPGSIGTDSDRVVILWDSLGRQWGHWTGQYDLGRTLTHELGHYLGLPHTFQSGCVSGAAPACYSNGDLICDTNPEGSPTSGCPGSRTSCSLPAPFHNYMDYSYDQCMNQFTLQQSRRIRCTIEHYRSGLFQPVIWYDDFETGNFGDWSSFAL